MSWNTKSKWIWLNKNTTDDTYGEFFTTFKYEGGDAKIRISADSNYTLFINGAFVDSGQYPDFPYFKVYDELDITHYCTKGENKLGIVVWHYGAPNMSYYPGNAALRFEVYSESDLLAYSDTNIQSRLSRTYKNGLCKQITSQLGFSFLYNSTLEDEWLNGKLEGFAESKLVNQELSLYKRPVKKLEIQSKRNSKLIKSYDGYYLFDIGAEEVGYLTLKVTSQKEQLLTICYGEHIADGKVRREIDGRDFSLEVIARAGITEYTNYFRRLGLRYLEIHSEYPIDIEYASVLPCPYPLSKVDKHFSDPLIQKIYDTSVRTLELCMHEHYEDCPWREQALYTMDSRNQMLCGYYAFREYEFPRANLHLISKDNRSDGLLSICTPIDIDLTIPSFSLHYFTQVYEYCVYSKDLTLAKEILPKLKSIISVFTDRIKDGLVISFSDENHWNFYEWRDGLEGTLGKADCPGAEAALNCLLSLALQNLHKICELLNTPDNYMELVAELNQNIYNHFFDKSQGLVANKPQSGEFSELVNALAILCGAVSGNEAENICDVLASPSSLTRSSLSMICFKYDALIAVNKEKYKAFIIDDIKSIYKIMLDAGATTFWETEDGESDFDNAGSLCHGWSAMPIFYFNELLD